MGKKLNKVYEELLEGATDGLKKQGLYDYVLERCPETSSKRIVKASLFALSDPHVRDRHILEAVYALAITYRLSALGVEYDTPEEDDDDTGAPSVSAGLKNKLESSTSPLPPVTAAEQDPSSSPDQLVH